MKKIFFTIDNDAFFAQIEEKKNPDYIDRPIAIGKLLNGKGVISTANYAARKYGINSGQPFYKAFQKYKDLIVVEGDYSEYSRVSNKIFETIASFSKQIEVASIDECYLEVSNITNRANAIRLAKQIQDKVLKETNITCSIGISDDKILSKIASNFKKPLGISTLFQDEIKEKLWNLDIDVIYGIGIQTVIKLKKEGIRNVGQLAKIDKKSKLYKVLESKISKRISDFIDYANGESNLDLNLNQEDLKSISFQKTFVKNTNDYEQLKDELSKTARNITHKLQNRNLLAKTVFLQMKDNPKRRVEFEEKKILVKTYNSKQITLQSHTDKYEIIFSSIMKIFDEWYSENREVGFIGAGVRNMIDILDYKYQLKLFDENIIYHEKVGEIPRDENDVDHLLRKLQLKYGKKNITIGTDYYNMEIYHNKNYANRDTIKFKRWDKKEL